MTIPAELMNEFEAAQHDIFRFEGLDFYAGDPNFDRYMAGESWQDTESKNHWCDLVRRKKTQGVRMQRVHCVTEPLSDYCRFELQWSYPPNVAAGEDIHVAPRIKLPFGFYWPKRDFWLFDLERLWIMSYDEHGALRDAYRQQDFHGEHSKIRGSLPARGMPLDRYLSLV